MPAKIRKPATNHVTHWACHNCPIGLYLSEDEKRELIDFLAENPLAGDEIPGTGGVRKVRFGPHPGVVSGAGRG